MIVLSKRRLRTVAGWMFVVYPLLATVSMATTNTEAPYQFFSGCDEPATFVSLTDTITLVINGIDADTPVCTVYFTAAQENTRLRFRFKIFRITSVDIIVSPASSPNDIFFWKTKSFSFFRTPTIGTDYVADEHLKFTLDRLNGGDFYIEIEVSAYGNLTASFKLSDGAVFGIVFGCLAAAIVIAITIGLICRRKCRKKKVDPLTSSDTELLTDPVCRQFNSINRNTLAAGKGAETVISEVILPNPSSGRLFTRRYPPGRLPPLEHQTMVELNRWAVARPGGPSPATQLSSRPRLPEKDMITQNHHQQKPIITSNNKQGHKASNNVRGTYDIPGINQEYTASNDNRSEERPMRDRRLVDDNKEENIKNDKRRESNRSNRMESRLPDDNNPASSLVNEKALVSYVSNDNRQMSNLSIDNIVSCRSFDNRQPANPSSDNKRAGDNRFSSLSNGNRKTSTCSISSVTRLENLSNNALVDGQSEVASRASIFSNDNLHKNEQTLAKNHVKDSRPEKKLTSDEPSEVASATRKGSQNINVSQMESPNSDKKHKKGPLKTNSRTSIFSNDSKRSGNGKTDTGTLSTMSTESSMTITLPNDTGPARIFPRDNRHAYFARMRTNGIPSDGSTTGDDNTQSRPDVPFQDHGEELLILPDDNIHQKKTRKKKKRKKAPSNDTGDPLNVRRLENDTKRTDRISNDLRMKVLHTDYGGHSSDSNTHTRATASLNSRRLAADPPRDNRVEIAALGDHWRENYSGNISAAKYDAMTFNRRTYQTLSNDGYLSSRSSRNSTLPKPWY